MKKTTLKLTVRAFAAVLLSSSAAHAAISLDFDSAPSGTAANSFGASGVNFQFGVYDYNYDSFGDQIPGTQHWQTDATAGPVLAQNPSIQGWGAAPSGLNALHALDQPVLMLLGPAVTLTQFSTKLDNSTFGALGTQNIEFYSSDDTLLGTLAVDQTIPGFLASYTGNIPGVSKILLPSSAFYDDINLNNFVPVPEASTWSAGALLIVGAVASLRRKRQLSAAL